MTEVEALMKRIIAASALVVVMLLSGWIICCAKGQDSAQVIRITANGDVEPSSVPIRRNGDTYVFEGDVITRGIVVEKENIAIDGEGYTLMGPYNGEQSLWIIGEGPDQPLSNETELWSIGIDVAADIVGDLTITNLNIKNFSIGMFLWSHNNRIFGNNITDGIVGILISGSNNSMTENFIANNKNGIFFGASEGTIPLNIHVSENRFVDNLRQLGGCVCIDFNTTEEIHNWDNGRFGNYWSDYNGVDANGDGIGDTPYVIDILNRDRYPLMGTVLPQPAALDIHVIFTIGVALTAILVVAILVGLRRRKKNNVQGSS
jgi:hypothetical protein